MDKRMDAFGEADSLYGQLFEQSRDGILLIREGVLCRANAAFCELLGYPEAELLGRDPVDLIHPEDRDRARARIGSIHAGEISGETSIYRTIRRDGSELLVEVATRRVRWEAADILQTIVRDVTESRATEAALRDAEARYRGLFDSLPIGIYRTTPDGKIVDANPALVEMLGYPDRATLLSRPVEEGYAERAARRAWQERIEREGVIEGSEAVWRTFDGKELWIEEHARAVRGPDGATRFYEGSAQEITDRKAIESALDREKAYFERLFAGAPEAVVLCSNDGIVQRVNREFRLLFGYTEAEAVGRPIDSLVAHRVDSMQAEASSITQSAKQGSATAIETVRHRKNGSLAYVSVMAQPIFLDRQQVGLYAIYRDIGRRVEAEQALQEEKARFEELFEASPEAIVLCTNESIILRVNEEFTRLFGYARDEAIGENVDVLLSLAGDGLREEAESITHRIADGEHCQLETRRRHRNGTELDVSILGKPIRMDGEQVAVYGIYRDISARKRAEAALRRAQTKVVELHAAAGRLERAETEDDIYHITTEAAEQILGFPHCALDVVRDGQLVTQAVSSQTPKQRIRRTPLREGGSAGRAFREKQTIIEGNVAPERLSERPTLPIRSLLTAPIREIGVFQVAAETADAFTEEDARFLEILLGHTSEALSRLVLQQELFDRATRDELTGVFNRRYFNEVLEQEVIRSTRYDHPIGLLMIDVNRFKEINDTRGHHVGDEVLRAIAETLVETVRATDFIVRYGGDEFLVVLTETGEEAEQAADRIRSAVAGSDRLREIAGLPVTVSVGTGAWEANTGETVEAVLAAADQRMYDDKRRQ